ncbi:MAG: LysM peptidoglycan-binding domain-containing protein [Balneolaceae bacterium]
MMSKIKKISLSMITAVFLAVVFQPCLYAQQTAEEHTVQEGETLYTIAREYDVSVNNLLQWNQLGSNIVSEGQILQVVPPESENRLTHSVEPGETLFSISRRYNVTIAEIQQWNDITGTNLDAGQELVLYPESQNETVNLPSASGENNPPAIRESIVRVAENTPGNAYYTVRSGDTLTRIAREHDMTVPELRQLNDLAGDAISVGQRLTVRQTQSTPSVDENSEDSTPQGKFVIYRAEENEDGASLLERFQMSKAELQALNPGVNPETISPGQRLTVLLPPSRTFDNPYRRGSNLEDLGIVPVIKYSENNIAASTTSGELYNPEQLTAAHPNMALGNVIYVENISGGQGIYVRINDRHSDDTLKLSHKAFDMLGLSSGDARVRIYLDQ